MHRVVVSLALVLTSPNLALAVLISTGDGTINNSAPATNDPGYANVVPTWVRTGSAVYLGNGWLLTTNHVGAGTTMIGGVFYDLAPGAAHQLVNPPGATFTSMSDVLLYRINGSPNLPSIKIGAGAPQAGAQVTMIGNGRDRNPMEQYWTPAWLQSPTPSAYAGFTWGYTNRVRWGTNAVESVGVPQGNGSTSSVVFSMSFSAANATPYEAIGTPGDSGGGVFSYNTSAANWELNGLMVSYTKFSGQPWNASVYGSTTYAIQLSSYRNQIMSYLTPGDLNGDSQVNLTDISLVATTWLTASTDGDANHDGLVNIADVSYIAKYWNGAGNMGVAGVRLVPEPETYALAITAAVGVIPFALGRFIRRRSLAGYGNEWRCDRCVRSEFAPVARDRQAASGTRRKHPNVVQRMMPPQIQQRARRI